MDEKAEERGKKPEVGAGWQVRGAVRLKQNEQGGGWGEIAARAPGRSGVKQVLSDLPPFM